MFFQLAYLSVECIPFGDVPLYTMSRRMFFLTNTSQDHIISFRWVSALDQVLNKQSNQFLIDKNCISERAPFNCHKSRPKVIAVANQEKKENIFTANENNETVLEPPNCHKHGDM